MIVPKEECQHALRKTKLGVTFKLHESFICAGGQPGKDTCKVSCDFIIIVQRFSSVCFLCLHLHGSRVMVVDLWFVRWKTIHQDTSKLVSLLGESIVLKIIRLYMHQWCIIKTGYKLSQTCILFLREGNYVRISSCKFQFRMYLFVTK